MKVVLYYAIAFTILMVVIVVSLILRHFKLKRKHTMSKLATVISTRSASKLRGDGEERYYATFELHNNKEKKELRVPKHMKEHVEVGEKGMITFTSQQLLYFNKGNHPSHLYTHFGHKKT